MKKHSFSAYLVLTWVARLDIAAVGASVCLATRIGAQTNTLFYGAGGYRFNDYLKVGLPLNLLFCVLAVYFIPKFWPF